MLAPCSHCRKKIDINFKHCNYCGQVQMHFEEEEEVIIEVSSGNTAWRGVIFALAVVGLSFLMYQNKTYIKYYWLYLKNYSNTEVKTSTTAIERTLKNYGVAIDSAAQTFNLPANYLKALLVLECSGHKPTGKRFEKKVYQKLKEVQAGERKRYENIKPKDLKDMSDGALRNLATSWGVFQLMGYKCFGLGIKIEDIRGEKSVYWGAKWINETYGKSLRQGKFKDAFHSHNTGQKYPKNGKPFTHDPEYVAKGLKYMEAF
jgi:hypothetical protein